MYLKALPSTLALTCHLRALSASEHSALGVVSLTSYFVFYDVDTHLLEGGQKEGLASIAFCK